LNAAEDIVENDELSEPEIQKFAFQISPLRLLFACETAEGMPICLSLLLAKS